MKRILFFLLSSIFYCTGTVYSLDGDLPAKLSSLHRRPTVGLVLSGGSARGFAHIGVLKYLEKEGIRPDYIAGTSMGSIVGSLYALGYSADQIEKIVDSQNWDFIISNRIAYRNMSMSEKADAGKYFMEFPFKKKNLKLPGSFIGGQHIMELINYYEAWSSFTIHNFKKLPIPFFCVAVNLRSGHLKVFTKGYLPDAVRASMAIPSVFAPKIIDGTPYIDGGIRNNFPADLMQKIFHPDIIIGSFAGIRPKKNPGTLTDVLTQTMLLDAFNLYKKTKKLCDILIEPDVYKYNLFSFDDCKSIIEAGEKAAAEKSTELGLLAKTLARYSDHKPSFSTPAATPLKFDKIQIEGLSHLSSSFVLKHLNITEGVPYTRNAVSSALSELYGTGYFKYVNYKLIKDGNSNILEIRLKEKSETFFKAGGYYDTDYQAVLPFNFTSFNFLVPNAKLKISGELSQNPSASLSYEFLPPGTQRISPAAGFSLDASNLTIDTYDPHTTSSTYSFDYTLFNFHVYLKSEISNALLMGIDAGLNYTSVKAGDYSQFIFQPCFFLKADTRDSSLFPEKGFFLNLKAKYLYNFNPGFYTDSNDSPHSILGRMDWKTYMTLFHRLTIEPSITLGLSDGTNVPLSQYFYLGGTIPYPLFGDIPLTPLHHFDLYGPNAFAANLSFRYHLLKKHFLSLSVSTGYAADLMEDLFDFTRYPAGIGLKYSYNSVIGPIELSMTYSTFSHNILYHLTVGFSR